MPLTLSAVLFAIATFGPGAPAPTDSLMGTGVSRALATARAPQIRDVRYALSFDLADRDSSQGTVTARFRVTKPGDVILDFRGQRLGSVELNGKSIATPNYNGA